MKQHEILELKCLSSMIKSLDSGECFIRSWEKFCRSNPHHHHHRAGSWMGCGFGELGDHCHLFQPEGKVLMDSLEICRKIVQGLSVTRFLNLFCRLNSGDGERPMGLAESGAGTDSVSSTQVTGEMRRPGRTLEIYREHAVSAKWREDSSRRGERPWDFLVLGSGAGDGPPDGCMVGQGLPSLLAGISTRWVGRAHRVSLFQFLGFSLVDVKACDFPTRGVAEKQKDSECAADGPASSLSGRAVTWLVSAPLRSMGKSGAWGCLCGFGISHDLICRHCDQLFRVIIHNLRDMTLMDIFRRQVRAEDQSARESTLPC